MNTSDRLRWGILGAGAIAHKLAKSVQARSDDNVLTAVGSRDAAKSDAFGAQYGIPNRHTGYDALVNDPEVDVIYVATPHPMHRDHCLQAIAAGKHVLCEKPFTLNAPQAQEVVDAARARGVFLMEAMWSRFFPLMGALKQLIADGQIGQLRMVNADFGFRAGFNPQSRLFDPNLGGGALLDVGVYAVSFASYFLGEPDRVAGLAEMGQTGVDEQSAFVLGYPGGQLALLSTAVRTNTFYEADIVGADGKVKVHSSCWSPASMTVYRSGKPEETLTFEADERGFVYEVDEVCRCIRAGRTESDILPLDETVAIMRTCDRIRAQWGLKYPSE